MAAEEQHFRCEFWLEPATIDDGVEIAFSQRLNLRSAYCYDRNGKRKVNAHPVLSERIGGGCGLSLGLHGELRDKLAAATGRPVEPEMTCKVECDGRVARIDIDIECDPALHKQNAAVDIQHAADVAYVSGKLAADADDEPDDKLRKAPRRARSVYMMWANANRQKFQRVGGGEEEDLSQVMRAMGNAFKKLSPAEREPYLELAEQDKARYEREMQEYQQAMAVPQRQPVAPKFSVDAAYQSTPGDRLMWMLTRNTVSHLTFTFALPMKLSVARYGPRLEADVGHLLPHLPPSFARGAETTINIGPSWRFESRSPHDPTRPWQESPMGALPPSAGAPAKYLFLLFQPESDKSNYDVVYRPDGSTPFRMAFHNAASQRPVVVRALAAPFSAPPIRRDVSEHLEMVLDEEGDGVYEVNLSLLLPQGTPLLLIVSHHTPPAVSDIHIEGAMWSSAAGNPSNQNDVVQVDGLPTTATEDALRVLFSCVAPVTYLRLEPAQESAEGTSTASHMSAWIGFTNPHGVADAIARFDGVDFGACRLSLRASSAPKSAPHGIASSTPASTESAAVHSSTTESRDLGTTAGAAAPTDANQGLVQTGFTGKLEFGDELMMRCHPHQLVASRPATAVKRFKSELVCSHCGCGTKAFRIAVWCKCGFIVCEACCRKDVVCNSDNVPVVRSEAGFYYCGRAVPEVVQFYNDCRICMASCGPNSGCNCGPCRALDVAEGRTYSYHDMSHFNNGVSFHQSQHD